jgi:thymidylate synthase ThyX
MTRESWSPEDEKKLLPCFTNLSEDVFGLKLPQEVAGALFSRYSRSTKSLRKVFLDEFLGNPDLALQEIAALQAGSLGQEEALKKAREFYDRVLVGYGDDSVAQLGGAHMACENISNIAANILEDARIGIAPLEKSTRYVRFDKKNAKGEYPFYQDPRLMASPFAEDFVTLMNFLFDTYARKMDPVIDYVRSYLPIEKIEFKHPKTGEPMEYREAERDPHLKKWADTAYRSTIRAQACDVLRSLLPMATQTNVGLFGVGQAYEYLLTKCYSCPLTELRHLASVMHRELNQLIPSFVKRAKPSDYLERTQKNVQKLADDLMKDLPEEKMEAVRLINYDPQAEEKILTAILFPGSEQSLARIQSFVTRLKPESRREVLDQYLKHRRHRRDKPGRALENASYTFEILCNIGIYRDLHRHRIMTQERQSFTVEHGHETPAEVIEMGLQSVFDECMERAGGLYRKMEKDFPLEAQYGVPFAYRVRWYLTVNLRELIHIVELRTMAQGHPDYRLLAQEMWRKVEAVHPLLAAYASFIDWNTYRLGRLQSELRTEYKKTVLSEQHRSG